MYPLSLYAAAAEAMMCAEADLAAPWLTKPGRTLRFRIFPVKKNDLAALEGSSAKPRTACWAATKALVVLMAISLLKPTNGIAKGSLGGDEVNEPAAHRQHLFG